MTVSENKVNVVEQAPKYKHDCDKCNFLGTLSIPESFKAGRCMSTFDLYHCEQGGFSNTLIGRHSSAGPDYQSGVGPAQYTVQQKLASGEFKTAKEALEDEVKNTDHLSIYVLCVAALQALEKGVMTEEQFLPKQ